MANKKIREKAKDHKVKLWQIADALGFDDSKFSRKLRKELTDEEQTQILGVIEEIAKQRGAESNG